MKLKTYFPDLFQPSEPGFWKRDFLSSIVVFLVALPLCMGIAIASGVPVAAGLITGIVGGLVVGALTGSPLQVSGPAAGLTVIVFDLVQRQGLEMLGLSVLIAGLVQIAAGSLRLGQWFRAVSPAVIKGMLTGIGVLIFASQFHVMVDDAPHGHGIDNLVSIPAAIQKGLVPVTLGEETQREAQTEMLQRMGELHRRQELLAERVAEHVPHHHQEASAAAANHGHAGEEPAEKGASDAAPRDLVAELEQLTVQQQELIDEARQAVALLPTLHAPEAERTDRLQARGAAAISAMEAALADLQAGNIDGVNHTQTQAMNAVASVLGGLKNHGMAARIGLLTILVIVMWQSFAPKAWTIVPAPLLAVVIGTAVAWYLSLPVLYVEVPLNLLNELHVPTAAILADAPWLAVLQGGLVIAVVASAETLLSATAVDQLHRGPRARYDQELVAQGVGNTICGFLGALPMTGVIVRSSANVQSGAKSRLSAIMHGIWLLVFVLLLASILRLVPTACLAAMLVYTGYKLMAPKTVKELMKYGRGEVMIYVVTVGTIVATDLLIGVATGIAMAGLKLLFTFSRLSTELHVNLEKKEATLKLNGAATFIRLPQLAATLERVPANSELHVDMERLSYIDHACFDLLMTWAKQHEATGGRLVVDWDSMRARFRAAGALPVASAKQQLTQSPSGNEAQPSKEDAERELLEHAEQGRNGRDTVSAVSEPNKKEEGRIGEAGNGSAQGNGSGPPNAKTNGGGTNGGVPKDDAS